MPRAPREDARSMEPVRLGLIGAGGIVRAAHLPALARCGDAARAAAVCDPHTDSARSLGAELGVPWFSGLPEMLDGMRGQIDAVVITSPHHLHAEQAQEALQRGLPALVEKPAVCTLAELRRLRDLGKTTGAFLQAGQQQRFGIQENLLKGWLRGPEFGEPRLFNLDIYQNIESYVSSKHDPWLVDGRRAGGGITISVAIHILDLLRYWLDDDFSEVYARGTFDPPMKNGAEATVAATLTMKRGTLGTLNATYVARRCPYSQRTVLFGTRGALCQHIASPGGGYAGPYYKATDGGVPTTEWAQAYAGWEPVGGPEEPLEAPFAAQLRHFAANVHAGRPGENSLERNANTLATVEAIMRSLASGRPEPVEIP